MPADSLYLIGNYLDFGLMGSDLLRCLPVQENNRSFVEHDLQIESLRNLV